MDNINNKIELLYIFIRYTVNLIYLIAPLYFVICHIIKFVNYILLNNKISKAIIIIFLRLLVVCAISMLILSIRGYGFCMLMQNYMQDKRSEYFFWILILIGFIVSFTSKKYLNFYKIKYENGK